WAAERIGHLLVKYESEWYADEALSKWNEIDELFEEEKQQKKESIEAILDKIGIIEPYHRDFAMKKVDEALEHVKSNWQLEKEQRIKPSLWWKEVAQAQAQNPTANTDANTPKLSNLSADGKAWFIHPVAMIDYFPKSEILFQKGDKHEIIREINIRLAGFGGNVPTDEFTERTEKMIKQFQRDYMQVEETGVVDIQVIQAIDRFQDEYSIDSFFTQAQCQCSTFKNLTEPTCNGFGLNKTNNGKTGANYAYGIEYPGLHRTLFWVLRSIMFYIDSDERYQHLTVEIVSSGYRCWADNIYNNRKSTNHMGKALDIHVIKKEKAKSEHSRDERINCCDLVRDILTEKTNAEYRWFHSNGIALENSYTRYHPTRGRDNQSIASVWAHYDVRVFESKFLENQFFVKTAKDINGKYLQELVKNLGS
ncbi:MULTISPECIES: peptidoglycan-binding domain-containing protein, partial [unclassified Gilliamella]|uniref:peptidoglycan-binding domain-containing protein n=1 Tax=unclassified Gilliamella TaxID=2685620 RepID=UPI000A692890